MMDIQELLKHSEGKTLEFKSSLASKERVLRTVVSFANTAGGILVIGVEDKTKRITGIPDPLSTELQFSNMVADTVVPRILPDIQITSYRGKYLLLIEVYPTSHGPVYIKSEGSKNGVYVRIGSTNRRADSELIEELKRQIRADSFDEQLLYDVSAEGIDIHAVTSSFQKKRKLRRSDLYTLQILQKHQGKTLATTGGFLLYGKKRLMKFPDAWIQVGVFAGTERAKILDSVELHDFLTNAMEEAMNILQRNIKNQPVISSLRRVDRPEIPLVALREALVNAVVHADYAQRGAPIRVAIFSDRIEIENPGLLPFAMTIEDIQHGVSKLRNRVIGRIFKELGFIEQWGSGIQRINAACAEAGLREPMYEEIATHFRVTLFREQVAAPLLHELDRQILRLLTQHKMLTTAQIANTIARSTRSTRDRLHKLVDRSLVIEIAHGPHDPHRAYALAKKS